MTDTVEQAPAPASDLIDVATKVAETVANPNSVLLVEDLMAVHKMAMDIKAKLTAMNHPTLWQIFHAILCS